ncbi:hypothetical protein PR001_g16125 [Phytophthora rubi]|uniref:RxLR effector protein n=1 Tax=Phytophthora rubi TaxID=129364 RepID=A0A6A3L4S1_9STRA|nr:hypothetical protein PR001_g16125 [Phytophthora rubi]
MNRLLIHILVMLSGVTNVAIFSSSLNESRLVSSVTTRELIISTNCGVHIPSRACWHPGPHSGSFANRTDSFKMMTSVNKCHR